MEEIEAALAKGGGEPQGADIAIVPLSSFVASYERLHALSPDIVFVIGWSRREALYAPDPNALAKLPKHVKLSGTAGTPETFFALFMLDLAGAKPELASGAPLVAAVRTKKPAGKLVVSSAETPGLMPLVAVAPHGFIVAHRGELETWVRVWLDGVDKLAADVPAGGRMVSTLAGAPPVIGIIEALGQIEFAKLRENASAVGLSGRGALTLDVLFNATWRIWRDAGVITTPAPDTVPLYTDVIASLARRSPTVASDRPKPIEGDRVLLVVTQDGKLDADAFVARIGYVAAVFDRQRLRISVKHDAKTAQLLSDTARDRFALRASQLSIGAQPKVGIATIEVLAAR
jgi:hypothetical protein